MDDARPVYLLGGHRRKTIRQIKPHLVAEYRDCTSSRTVTFLLALSENATQEIEILLHMPTALCTGSPSRMRLEFH